MYGTVMFSKKVTCCICLKNKFSRKWRYNSEEILLKSKSTIEIKRAENIVNMKVKELIPYARNSLTHSPEQILKLRSSIREFGFTTPILIDQNWNVIAGHDRLLAAREEGMEEIPCIILDYLTPAQRKAYIIADNRLARDGIRNFLRWNSASSRMRSISTGMLTNQ